MNKNIFFVAALIALIAIIAARYADRRPPLVQQEQQDTTSNVAGIEVIAENLDIPWEVAFLPANSVSGVGEILVTERPGTLLLLKGGQKIPIEGVSHVGEGGLLGLAVHPNFSSNHWIYLYLTTGTDGNLTNKVERYRLEGSQLSERKVIISGISGSANHDGGRIAFGPASVEATAGKSDYYLYITTGDAENPQSAQNINSLNGKILRVKDDGSIPPDNPFGNAVYSWGHRNSQGLAWDNQGRLWATEHGRSGIQSGLDELNLIEKGKNYGWPVIQGDQKREGMVSPVIQSGPNTTWAPSGATFYDGSIFFSGLRGEALFEYRIDENSLKTHFQGEFGRIRAVVLGPDGYLYLTTSNTDGRGNPKVGDDKLIKVNPKIFR